jgi:hypothetical protein
MRAYIQLGGDARHYGDRDEAELNGVRPTNLDWRQAPGFSVQDPKPENWTWPQLAGYYWYLVSWWRSQRPHLGTPLTQPNWKRLLGALDQTGRTKSQVFESIRRTIECFDIIRYLCRPKGDGDGIAVTLDERTLTDVMVNTKLAHINSLTQEELDELEAKANEWAAR